MNKFEQLMDDLHVQRGTRVWSEHEIIWNKALESQATLDTKPHPMHHVGVAVVVWSGNEVLLQHRRKDHGHGKYVLVGGTMDEADPVDAALRELKEELGVSIPRVVHGLTPVWFANDMKSDGSPYLMLYYALNFARRRGTEQNMEPDKCYGLHWCKFDHLPLDMWPNDLMAIEMAYQNTDWGLACQR